MPPGVMTPPAQKQNATVSGPQPVADADAWKKKNFWQLFNISVGFLGIQFAWAIQNGQMGPLLERLGSDPQMLGLISCAGPVTGVLVQPIVGALSDRCGLKLGRRRPFLLLGAILTVVSLVWMPNVTALWMAAVLLWILDASINITQGPYRSLVPDVVHPTQQATAYSLMSFTIGLGSVAAFLIAAQFPNNLHELFYMGAGAMLLAMMWTSFTTPERPIQPKEEAEAASGDNFIVETVKSIVSMPKEGLKLCIAHSLSWFGLTCLFTFFSVFVPHHVFGATDPNSLPYKDGVQLVQICYAIMNGVCFLFSMLIGRLCAMSSKKAVHSLGLICMAGAFLSMMFLKSPTEAMIAMGLVGVGWATTLSIPFALLSDHLPKGKEGVMMGTFNIFIAAPGVVSNLIVGMVVHNYFNDNVAIGLMIGGISVILSVLILQTVKERKVSDTAAVSL
jgi:maltose/moltooligosaccharide transporter